MTASHLPANPDAMPGEADLGGERVDVGDIITVAEMIWATLFELPLLEGSSGDCGPGPTITACVQIDGAWAGAVVVQCSLLLASTLTAALFLADEAPSVDEVVDAIGELTNMMAGNIKSLLPEPCRISLPAVALGSEQHFSVNGTSVMAKANFTCDGRLLSVTVLSRDPSTSRQS